MKNISGWIKTFRPQDGIFSAGMTYVSLSAQQYFTQLNKHHLLLFILIIFLLVSLSMSANDWFDRRKDLLKNKRFASKHAKSLLLINMLLWLITAFLVYRLNQTELKIFMPLILIHLFFSPFYSLGQKIIFLPTLIVAISVASLMLYAGFLPQADNITIVTSFLILLLIIFAREIIKDFQDKESDKNFKKTIPLIYNQKISLAIIITILTISFILMVVFNYINVINLAPFLLCIYFLRKNQYKQAKLSINVVLFIFFSSWWIT